MEGSKGGLKNTSPRAIHSLFGALSILMVAVSLFPCILNVARRQRRRWFKWCSQVNGLGSWIAAAISMTIAAKNFRKRISDTEAAFNICLYIICLIAILIGIGEELEEKELLPNQLRLFQIIALFSLFSAGVCTYLAMLIYRT
uniref:Uncharacterized protein n=1 Tax=Ditylenchus dipsaci TaxID=166011 RepID=A0A915DS51_9BILA